MTKHVDRVRRSERAAIEAALAGAIKNSGNDATVLLDKLLTERERITIGRRLLIANLIIQGKTQMEINNLLNVSPNTYTKIRRWLDDQLPNFEAATHIDRERNQKVSVPRKRYLKPYTLESARQKLPMHFLLFNIAEKIISDLGKK